VRAEFLAISAGFSLVPTFASPPGPLGNVCTSDGAGNWTSQALTSGFAPLISPAFTGIPTGPTAAPGTNTNQLATTAFVATANPANLTPTTITMAGSTMIQQNDATAFGPGIRWTDIPTGYWVDIQPGAVVIGGGAGYITNGISIFGNPINGGQIGLAQPTKSGNFVLFAYNGLTTLGSINGNGSGISYNTTSDGRLKIDDGPIDPGTLIDRIKPHWFRWQSDPDAKREPGFFAQELRRVWPWAVTKGKGRPGSKKFRPWMTDQSKLMPIVIAELQALRRRVRELERAS